MMASSLCHKATTLCGAKLSAAGPVRAVVGSIGFPSSLIGSLPSQSPQNQQQVRFRVTKAKKKRIARALRRQEMAEQGIEVPKPPGYFPKDTPVENVVLPEVLAQRIQVHDEKVKKELEAKRAILAQEKQLRFQMTGLTMSDRVRKLFDMNNGNQLEVVQYQKHSGMRLFELREGDTGSSSVQVVALTARIQQLQTHMRNNHKDKSSKRGLIKLITRRRKILDYMERKDFEAYRRVVKSLGLARK